MNKEEIIQCLEEFLGEKYKINHLDMIVIGSVYVDDVFFTVFEDDNLNQKSLCSLLEQSGIKKCLKNITLGRVIILSAPMSHTTIGSNCSFYPIPTCEEMLP